MCNAVGHVGGAIAPVLVVAVEGSLGFGVLWPLLGALIFAVAVLLLFTRNTTGIPLESVAEAPPAR